MSVAHSVLADSAFDHVTSRWTFSEGVGSTVKDEVGTSDIALVNSPTWGANEIHFSGGGLLELFGSYGRAAVLDDLTGPLAVTFDLKVDTFPTKTSVIFKKEDGAGNIFALLYDSATAGYQLLVNNKGQILIPGQQKITAGQWYHFAVVYNGGTTEVWVDGHLDISERISLPHLTPPIYRLTLASNTPET
ncbi:MAG TPA: LamG-like jellyroll fold domain-containing protein, partial [Chthoniobacterales bacterium]|nr:LamG-like jellyroll fold domain-containing protein [Chthoniobacterales bacterium]